MNNTTPIYADALKEFIKEEFRSEMRDRSNVVIDCLVCKQVPSKSCKVCYPSTTSTDHAAKKLLGYTKNNSGTKYADLLGSKLEPTQETEKSKSQKIERLHKIILDLRTVIENMETEKSDILQSLKSVTELCNQFRSRQKSMEHELDMLTNVNAEQAKQIEELEAIIAQKDNEIKDLRTRCSSSEACRSHGARELTRLRTEQKKQQQALDKSVFSLRAVGGSLKV